MVILPGGGFVCTFKFVVKAMMRYLPHKLRKALNVMSYCGIGFRINAITVLCCKETCEGKSFCNVLDRKSVV